MDKINDGQNLEGLRNMRLMRKSGFVGLMVLLFCCGSGGGTSLPLGEPLRSEIRPFGQAIFVNRLEGKKRASAIAIGDGSTFMGLYVFDRWGNCVAKDDYSGSTAARDDLAVEWFPPEAGQYTIELRNFGRSSNAFTIVLR